MERQPRFLTDFSKAHFAAERTSTAQRVHFQRWINDRTHGLVRLGSPKDTITLFNAEQAERWVDAPCTKEEAVKLFTPEHLASLSLDEYALLWRRFPQTTVAHVTSQGLNDHHLGGGWWSYDDRFKQILKIGTLHSPVGLYFQQGITEDTVHQFMSSEVADGRFFRYPKESARRNLERFLDVENARWHVGAGGSYSDRSALHFAVEEVANREYGWEKGNEIFFVFPAMFIASQFHYNGYFDREANSRYNLKETMNIDDPTNYRYLYQTQIKQVKFDSGNSVP